MTERRVAVTGIGLVCALGRGRDAVWRRLVAGECGLRPVTIFDASMFRSHCGGQLADEPTGGVSRHEARRWSRSDRIAVEAAAEALADAGLAASGIEPTRVGVWLGTGTGDLLRNESYFFRYLDDGPDRARPSHIYHHSSSTTTDLLAERFGLYGSRGSIVAACSSSTIAIGQASDAIRFGDLDAALCGGADAFSRLTFSGFNVLRLMDSRPCRPFDRGRNGMNIGEGAAMMVLEELDRARRRGATIYAELAGWAFGCEAYHATAPEPDGRAIASTLSAALACARVTPDDIAHINAHGTATPQNDVAEARAIHRVFGERSRRLPVTSIKSMVGHCLGTAGALEAAATALTIHHGVIPPTIHHEETDPECAVEVVANVAREAEVPWALSTSLAFGGNDSALVLRAVR
ncbi:MAG: beta-ketoacyl-[acyl-carrier-protein] synthase family protein [Vicinamibacterales bacterium]